MDETFNPFNATADILLSTYTQAIEAYNYQTQIINIWAAIYFTLILAVLAHGLYTSFQPHEARIADFLIAIDVIRDLLSLYKTGDLKFSREWVEFPLQIRIPYGGPQGGPSWIPLEHGMIPECHFWGRKFRKIASKFRKEYRMLNREYRRWQNLQDLHEHVERALCYGFPQCSHGDGCGNLRRQGMLADRVWELWLERYRGLPLPTSEAYVDDVEYIYERYAQDETRHYPIWRPITQENPQDYSAQASVEALRANRQVQPEDIHFLPRTVNYLEPPILIRSVAAAIERTPTPMTDWENAGFVFRESEPELYSNAFIAENLALLIRDFFKLSSWGDYVALCVRVHYLLRPGVSVAAEFMDDLLMFKKLMFEEGGGDPFQHEFETTQHEVPDITYEKDELGREFVNCGKHDDDSDEDEKTTDFDAQIFRVKREISRSKQRAKETVKEAKEKATRFAQAAPVWHKALSSTKFGRIIGTLIRLMFGSVVLSQAKTAVKGASWAHLLFGQEETAPPKDLNLGSLIEWGVTLVKTWGEITSLIIPAVESGDPSRIFNPSDPITQIMCRVKQAITAQAEYYDSTSVHYDPVGWVSELQACSRSVRQMMGMPDLSEYDKSTLRRLLIELEVVIQDAEKRAVHLNARKQPFFMLVTGPPGTGKTDNIDIAAFSCLMRNKDSIPHIHTYAFSGTVKYHDGYNGNEPVVRVEDPTLSIKCEFDPLQFVSMMKSHYPYCPNMAAVELKNKRFACPKILIVTSNEANPALKHQMPASAFARRADVCIDFTINEEFEDKHGIGLDPVKIAANNNGDYYRARVGKWVIDPNMKGNENPSIHKEWHSTVEGGWTTNPDDATVFTPAMLNDFVASLYVEHMERETKAVALKNLRKDVICSRCKIAYAVHGSVGCPKGGAPVAYDNPANKLESTRWVNSVLPEEDVPFGPAEPTRSERVWAGFLKMVDNGAERVKRAWWAAGAGFAITTTRVAWPHAWALLRGRGTWMDVIIVNGIANNRRNYTQFEKLLSLRKETWVKFVLGAIGVIALSSVAFKFFASENPRSMIGCQCSPAGLAFRYERQDEYIRRANELEARAKKYREYATEVSYSNCDPGPRDEEKWKNAGLIQSRTPWMAPGAWQSPPFTTATSGTTLAAIQADVLDRLVRIEYPTTDGGKPIYTVGMAIGGDMVLTFEHAILEVRRRGGIHMKVTCMKAIGPHVTSTLQKNRIFEPPDGDWCVIRVPEMNARKKFRYFAPQLSRGHALATTALVRPFCLAEKDASELEWTEPTVAQYVPRIQTNGPRDTTDGWLLPSSTAGSGDCGSVLLTEDGTFLGMLTNTSQLNGAALFQGFSEVEFRAARKALSGEMPAFENHERGIASYGTPEFPMEMKPLEKRSTFNRIPPGWEINGRVEGTIAGYNGAKNTSPMVQTPFINAIAEDFPHVRGKWAPPHGRVCEFDGMRMDPFDRMLKDLAEAPLQKANREPVLVDAVIDRLVERMVRVIPGFAGNLRADLDACLNGDELMRGIDLKTSAGFLCGGAKSNFVDLDGPRDEGGRASLQPRVMEVWNALTRCYEARTLPPMIVRVFLKLNEVRPAEKIEKAGTRTINCIPFPVNLKVKSVFGRLSAYLQRYKEVTGIQIGLNMGGPELERVLSYAVNAKSFTRAAAEAVLWADWDTKHQDLSLDRYMILSAFRVMIGVAERIGADAALVEEMWFWAQVLAEPMAILKGGDSVTISYNSSGHQLTTEVNSFAALIGYYYAVARIYGIDFAFNEFWVLVYGDDILMRALSQQAAKMMTPELWVDGLAEYGLFITPGSKRPGDRGEYRKLSDCTFLKRRIYEMPVSGDQVVWAAALEEDSILKGLSWYEPSKKMPVTTASEVVSDYPLPAVQQLCVILGNAQREWWMHGRDVFEERTEKLKRYERSFGADGLVEWYGFDEFAEQYHSGRFTTMSL